MSFFKKIGTAIKKNVNLKNVLKVATPLMGAIPFVGGTLQNTAQGLQDNYAAKKAQQQAESDYNKQVDEQNKQYLLNQAKQATSAIAQGTAQTFGEAITSGAYDGLSQGVKNATAKAGVTIADLTITEWLKKNWLKVATFLSAFFLAIWFITKPRTARRARRR